MSLCDDLLLEVSKYLRQEIGCLAIDDHHLLVSLPISFADGDAVEVLVHERDGQIVVSDS